LTGGTIAPADLLLPGITLIGGLVGQAGWKAVFPNEKHEFFAGWRASRLYTGRASGSTLSWSVEKDWPECCLFTLCAAR